MHLSTNELVDLDQLQEVAQQHLIRDAVDDVTTVHLPPNVQLTRAAPAQQRRPEWLDAFVAFTILRELPQFD